MQAEFWSNFLEWFARHRLGDLANIVGVIISVIGFAITVVGVYKSKNAAERAEEAAKSTRDSIRLLDTVVDFTAAIAILEEIKRSHRQDQWGMLPDRYAAIRKILLTLKGSGVILSVKQKEAVQKSLVNLNDMERTVERALASQTSLKAANFNKILSADIDRLLEILVEIKSARHGV